MKFVSAILISALAFSAQAGILSQVSSGKKIETVETAKSATLSVNKQDISLEIVGAGLRSKKVVIANVKVYVAQLLSSDASKFVNNEAGALKSLDDSRTTAITLTFLRTVDAPTVQQSFKDALKANNVDMNEKAVADFLAAVNQSGDALEKKTLTIATQKNADGSETLYYEGTNGKLSQIEGSKGLTSKIMSIWLGNPADSGVAALKADIVRGFKGN